MLAIVQVCIGLAHPYTTQTEPADGPTSAKRFFSRGPKHQLYNPEGARSCTSTQRLQCSSYSCSRFSYPSRKQDKFKKEQHLPLWVENSRMKIPGGSHGSLLRTGAIGRAGSVGFGVQLSAWMEVSEAMFAMV